MLRIVALLLTLAVPAPLLAGGPEAHERQYVTGRCPDGSPCSWDCSSGASSCEGGGECSVVPWLNFNARLRLTVDEAPCAGAPGAHLTIALAGKRRNGSTFTVPDVTLDYCGLPEADFDCEPSKRFKLCGPNPFESPRRVVFQCSAGTDEAALGETSGGFPGRFWLDGSDLPPAVEDALRAAFPGVPGVPIVFDATELDYVDNSANGAPSTRDLCAAIGFVQPGRALEHPKLTVPTAVSAASLAYDGACLDLPGSDSEFACCNGIDDDADGATDFADTDCCSAPPSAATPLVVESLKLKTGKKDPAAGSVKLKARLPDAPFLGADATAGNVSLQVAQAGEAPLCFTLPRVLWSQKGQKPSFSFVDGKGVQATMLKSAKLNAPDPDKPGKGSFRASSLPIVDTTSFAPGDVTVGFRVGTRCASATVPVSASKRGVAGP